MKQKMRRIVLPFLILGLCTASGHAADEKASRAATKKDLVGHWQMVSVRPVHDKNDATFYPYQRYTFNADSSMKFITSDKPFTKEWLDKFRKQPASIDYTMDGKGVLMMTWQTPVHSESAVCAYVLRDVPPEMAAKLTPEARKGLPKKGDLTLSFLNSRGKISYQKVLTKIP